mgnify:CR=1 FL=1
MRRFRAPGLLAAVFLLTALSCASCGGSKWSSYELGKQSSFSLTGVSACAEGRVWVVGNPGVAFRRDGRWFIRTYPGARCSLLDVFALDPDRVWAVGDGGNAMFYGGNSWSGLQLDPPLRLAAVSGCDASHVWAVGDGGTVQKYDGLSWVRQESGVTWNLSAVSALDPDHVWAVGSGGIIFFDGERWSLQWEKPGNPVFAEFSGVSALDPTHAWAVASSRGEDWKPVSRILFFDGVGWKEELAERGEVLRAVSVAPDGFAAAVGDQAIWQNYGSGWKKYEGSSSEWRLVDVSCVSGRDAWAVGYTSVGTLYAPLVLRYDGVRWVEVELPGD